ncbi:hypothetical protein M758_7G158200 [Ceratodon purpureus]|nr:hypothetical protein M758_7G158000 [Ceratodon purpureus]KAG0611683.1 hypothetical protein M758_7G158200 [Ceratodon purpureus]
MFFLSMLIDLYYGVANPTVRIECCIRQVNDDREKLKREVGLCETKFKTTDGPGRVPMS